MLTPLAVAELERLFTNITSGNLDDIRAWCTRNAARTRKRERHVLLGLTAAVMFREYENRGPDAPFAALIPDTHQEPWQLMCNRLGAATLNDDLDTVDALVEAWALWPAEEREKALAGFAWKLYNIYGPSQR